MIRKIVSAALSAAICVTGVFSGCTLKSTDSHEWEGAETSNSSNNEYNLDSTNSLGNFIVKSSQKSNNIPTQLSNKTSSVNYEITSLEFDSETGIVQIASTQPEDAKIVVSFVNDESSENTMSLETTVNAGKLINSMIKADISKLPQYYIVKAQLFDKLNRPVGKEYTFSKYTKDIQEILATDITAFNEEQAVNLDEDETTNFIVLSENTVKAESSEKKNTLVSADYNNNVFVFDNADKTIASLQKGQFFFVQPDYENIIAVKVEDVEADGNTVTVSGNGDIDDMFDFVKIESVGDLGKAQIDTSYADEGVSFPNIDENGNVIVDENGLFNFEYEMPQYKENFEATVSSTIRLDADLNENFGGDDWDLFEKISPDDSFLDGDKGKVSRVTGSVTISFNINYYKKLSSETFEFAIKVTPDFTYSVGAYGYPNHDIQSLHVIIAVIKIPTSIPLTVVEIQPRLFAEISGKVLVNITWDSILGFYFVNGELTRKEIFDEKNIKADIKLEGEVYGGLELQIYLTVVSEKIAAAGIDAKAGLRVRAEASLAEVYEQASKNAKEPPDEVIVASDQGESYHACKFCVEAKTDFVFKADLVLIILGKKLTLTLIEIEIAIPYLKAHFSSEDGFGLGECNYNRYRINFHEIDNEDGAYTKDVVLKLGNEKGSKTINVNSKCSTFYCLPGTYHYDVSHKGKTIHSGDINVSIYSYDIPYVVLKDNKTITTQLTTKTGLPHTTATTTERIMVTNPLPDLSSDTNQIIFETGLLGENIPYMLYSDGYLYASGYGEMYDFTNSPFSDPSKVKEVIIENIGDEEDEIITSIGNGVFNNCNNLESITMPHTIKRIGNYGFANCTSFSKITFAEYFDKETGKVKPKEEIPEGMLTFPKALKTIGDYAFYNCSLFHEVVITDRVTDIGAYAFSNCTEIKELNLNYGLESIGERAFQNCSVSSLVVPDTVTYIGPQSLSGCTLLKELTIPFAGTRKEVTDAGSSTDWNSSVADLFIYNWTDWQNGAFDFSGYALEKITVTGGEIIPDYAFSNMPTLKEVDFSKSKVTTIGEKAFYNCTSLTDIKLPETISYYGNYSFYNTQITSLPKKSVVTSVGDYAFADCTKLKEFVIPETCTRLGIHAFRNCVSLTEMVIPESVEYMGEQLLLNCSSISELTLPYAGTRREVTDAGSTTDWNSSVADLFIYNWTDWQNGAFDFSGYALEKITVTGGEIIPDYAFSNMPTLKEVDFSKSKVTTIGEKAFYNCTSLTDIKLPETISSYGNYSFYNTQITSLPKKSVVTSVGDYAFAECTKLQGFVIPDTLRTIGSYAFSNCTEIKELDLNYGLESIGERAFQNCSISSLVVPDTVTYIGPQSLSGCTLLKELTIPFAGTRKEVTDAGSSTDWNSSVADLFIYNWGDWQNGGFDFSDYALEKITITGGEQIPSYAFSGMPTIKEIDIYNSEIALIDTYAFNGCTSLTYVNIPTSVKEIKGKAFSGSNADVYIYNKSCVIADDTFDKAYSGTIYGYADSTAETFAKEKDYKFVPFDGEIVIGPKSISLLIGEKYTLRSNYTGLEYISSDPTIASVDSNGVISGVKAGRASIEVKAGTNGSCTLNINVKQPTTTTTTSTITTTSSTATTTTAASTTTTSSTTTTAASTTTTSSATTTAVSTTTTSATTTTAASTTTTSATKTTAASTTTTSSATTTAVSTTTTSSATTTAASTTTTSVTTTTAASTTTLTTISASTTTSSNISSDEQFVLWAIIDYKEKTGNRVSDFNMNTLEDDKLEIILKDVKGKVLDTYTIDRKTGEGKNSADEVVVLPRTGNNSMEKVLIVLAALMMIAFGVTAVMLSGVYGRRRKEDGE